MTVNSSANSVIFILFAFSDNLSAESSKSSADYSIQLIQLLECMSLCTVCDHFERITSPRVAQQSNGLAFENSQQKHLALFYLQIFGTF